jgi:hypothetical protein
MAPVVESLPSKDEALSSDPHAKKSKGMKTCHHVAFGGNRERQDRVLTTCASGQQWTGKSAFCSAISYVWKFLQEKEDGGKKQR